MEVIGKEVSLILTGRGSPPYVIDLQGQGKSLREVDDWIYNSQSKK